MTTTKLTEYWLRGPVTGIPPLLQPVAHALLQAKDEVTALMEGFPDELLWLKPAGMASPGFHLQHLRGVLDRLFTYAAGRQLTPEQLAALKAEGTPVENGSTQTLLTAFQEQVDRSVEGLKYFDEKKLTETRGLGRAQLPSTIMGLLFHAAEHSMRHNGQLLVTVNVLKANAGLG